jgi:Uma2 family endonuclease
MTALAERKTEGLQPEVQRRRFSFVEFEQMSDLGLFADEHVELLNGEITVKGLQSPAHAYAVLTLDERLKLALQTRAVVAVQLPCVLSAPPSDFVEPDIALRVVPSSRYATRNATPEDTLLIVEISERTLERDRTFKLEAYARNGIQEYWILNLSENELEVHREPDSKTYISRRILKPGQPVSPLAFDDVQIEWWASV